MHGWTLSQNPCKRGKCQQWVFSDLSVLSYWSNNRVKLGDWLWFIIYVGFLWYKITSCCHHSWVALVYWAAEDFLWARWTTTATIVPTPVKQQSVTDKSVGLLSMEAFLSVGGFFLACKNFGGRFDDWIPASASFFSFFFKVKISSHVPMPLFFYGQDQAETTVTECFPNELRMSSFSLIGSHTVPGQHSQPTLTLLGQGCMHV